MTKRTACFHVHSYEVDASRQLTLPALAGYLQEIAGDHATELGWGLELLIARGITWVLVRQRIELLAPVALGSQLEVTTWTSGVHQLLATREFSVTREGQEVARASTGWLLIDFRTRKPVRPGDFLDVSMVSPLDPVAPIPARLPVPGEGAVERRFEVRHSALDLNQHVTNVRYLEWALDAVPDALWERARPCAVEVHYLNEALLGDLVLSRRAEGGGGEMLHSLLRESDGKELARLRTRWSSR